MENITTQKHVGEYTINQQDDEIMDYYADADGYHIVMQIMRWEFKYRDDPLYIIDALVMKDGEIVADFRPTTNTQHSTPSQAYDVLKRVMRSYSPDDVLHDEIE